MLFHRFLRKNFSTLKEIKKVGVVGSGQMGTGIALVLARHAKVDVKVVDIDEVKLASSRRFTEQLLLKEISKKKLSHDEKYEIFERISYGFENEDLWQSDLVIEAVNENFDLKAKIFKSLDEICPPEAILASNTSSISITSLAAVTKRPSKVIGMHWMNPVPVMKLVEVIKGLQTSQETLQLTTALAEASQKTVVKSEDIPGFIANRILMPYINEAIWVLYEGIASREDIDACMKLGTNVPMGPLTLADFIGLDTCLAILKVLHEGLGDNKYRPCPLLTNYVNAGYHGKKSGRGFYEYEANK